MMPVHPNHAVHPNHIAGLEIEVAGAVGHGANGLSAFDDALHLCGLANRNMINLSSVIPPASTIAEVDRIDPPGRWGDRTYVVMANERTEEIHTEVWAGVGWAIDPSTGAGVMVEHEGRSETKVTGEIADSLDELIARRPEVELSERGAHVVGGVCAGKGTCALVIAHFLTVGWDQDPNGLSTPPL